MAEKKPETSVSFFLPNRTLYQISFCNPRNWGFAFIRRFRYISAGLKASLRRMMISPFSK
ncbi:MAG: hypothetical protein M2R45_00988 [Verrucomicrobia subdivision 3 bacterium]|nr:hypothetical protein [Limisphaerales bacterium]MCS1414098.1 hypothetical protein [Limisphaerales bacterium]